MSPYERRFNLRTTDEELAAWRQAAERDGVVDSKGEGILSTWFRLLAAREMERQRRREK